MMTRGQKKTNPFKCPLCAETFRTLKGLRWHVKKDHPAAYDVNRHVLSKVEQKERLRLKREQLALESKKTHPLVAALIEHGCPCGRSKRWHLQQEAKFGRKP